MQVFAVLFPNGFFKRANRIMHRPVLKMTFANTYKQWTHTGKYLPWSIGNTNKKLSENTFGGISEEMKQ